MFKRAKFLSIPLAAACIFFSAIFTPTSYASEPYGGYNIGGNVTFGKYRYPDALKKHFDDKVLDVILSTPTLDRLKLGTASDAQGVAARATTHDEMKSFIAALPSDYMRVVTLGEFPSLTSSGESSAAFDLPMLVFAKPAAYDASALKSLGKPVVYLQGQIHGDETSGGEAMLAIAADLATNKNGLLDKISVVVIPRFNVDGAWKNKRGTDSAANVSSSLDPNRDAVAVISPISRAVRNMFVTYRPDVFADFHEMGYDYYGGGEYTAAGMSTGGSKFYYEFDIATLVAHPANVPAGVTKLAYELIGGVWGDLSSAGLSAERYTDPADMVPGYRTGRVDGINVVRRTGESVPGYATYPMQLIEGAPDENITDSAASLAPSVSLMFESRSPKILTNYKTRVYAHYRTGMSVLTQVAARPKIFLDAVGEARDEVSSSTGDVVLWSKQSEIDNPDLTVLSLTDDKASFIKEAFVIEKIHVNEGLTPVKAVTRPRAYIISADREAADAIAARIALTGVSVSRLDRAAKLPVEAYRVDSVSRTGSASLGYSVRSADYFNGSSALKDGIDSASAYTLDAAFPAGTYLFFTAQPSANLGALVVEPMANRNLGNYWNMLTRLGKAADGFIPAAVGSEYPVYRYMGAETLETTEMSTEFPMLKGAYVERSVPFDYASASPGSVFGYDFVVRYPTGATPVFFDMIVPKERSGKKILAWHLYNWQRDAYERADITTSDGVDQIRVRADHIASNGEVRATATDKAADDDDDDTNSGSGGGCTTGTAMQCAIFAFFAHTSRAYLKK